MKASMIYGETTDTMIEHIIFTPKNYDIRQGFEYYIVVAELGAAYLSDPYQGY